MEETDAPRHPCHLRSAVGWYKRCDNLSNSGSRGNWPDGIHAALDICHLRRRCCQRQFFECGIPRQDRAEENASHGICLDGILPLRHDPSRVEIRGDHQQTRQRGSDLFHQSFRLWRRFLSGSYTICRKWYRRPSSSVSS